MPWRQYDREEFADHYEEPRLSWGSDPGMVDFLIAKKRSHAADRDQFLAWQKAFGRGDPEFGRFMREQAACELKHYRACCFALSRIARDPPGDCRDVQASKELAPYIDQAFGFADLDWCKRQGIGR